MRAGPSTNDGRRRRCVMRRPEWPLAPPCQVQRQAKHRVYGRRFQGLAFRHWRENSGQATSQHALAGARRPDEQDIVSARCRNLQTTFCVPLSFHFAQIRLFADCDVRPRLNQRRQRAIAMKMSSDLQQVGGDSGFHFGQSRLCFICVRHKNAAPGCRCFEGRRKNAGNGANVATQSQLTVNLGVAE